MKEKIMEKWSEENRKKSNKRVGENWTDVSWLLCGGVCVCAGFVFAQCTPACLSNRQGKQESRPKLKRHFAFLPFEDEEEEKKMIGKCSFFFSSVPTRLRSLCPSAPIIERNRHRLVVWNE